MLISLVVILLVVGILWWAITQIPLPPPVGVVVRVAFAVIVALAILEYFFGGGVGGSLSACSPHLGRL